MDMSSPVYVDPRSSSRAEKRQRKSLAPTSALGSGKKEELASTPPESTPPHAEKRTRRKHTSRMNSKSVSLGEDSEDDVKPIVKAKRPQKEESSARKRVKKEDEDVKPEINAVVDDDIKPRRSSRARQQDAIPSIYLDASDDEEDNDVNPRRNSRSRAPSARASSAETDEEKKRIKKEKKRIKLEEDYQQLAQVHATYIPWDLPPGIDAAKFSVLDPYTWHDVPELQTEREEVEILDKVKLFHFHSLKIGNVGAHGAYDKLTERINAGYKHDLYALHPELNLGMTTPGKPFVITNRPRSWDSAGLPRYREPTAIFVDQPVKAVKGKNGKKEKISWKAFGMYKVVWQGRMKDGEFLKLSEEKQKKIQSIFEGYLNKDDGFSKLVFQNCYLDVDDPEVPNGRRLIHIRDKTLTKIQRQAHIRTCLEENRDLVMYWSMYAYVGNNAKELADLEARRDFRY